MAADESDRGQSGPSTTDESGHIDLVDSAAVARARPDTPRSASPDFKRPRILRKPKQDLSEGTSAQPDSMFQAADLLALKRDLLLEEHQVRLAAIAEEKELNMRAIQLEVSASQAKERYYNAKHDAIFAKPQTLHIAPTPPYSAYPGYIQPPQHSNTAPQQYLPSGRLENVNVSLNC